MVQRVYLSAAACVGLAGCMAVGPSEAPPRPDGGPFSVLDAGSERPVEPVDPAFEYPEPGPAAATQMPTLRLTHAQWARAVVDAVDLSSSPPLSAAALPSDRGDGFAFGQDPDVLEVSANLYDAYRAETEAWSLAVVGDDDLLVELTGTLDFGEPEVVAIIDRVGPRAFREPVSDADREGLLGLYEAGLGRPLEGVSGPRTGLSLVLRGIFLSPKFLYRTPPEGGIAGEPIALNGLDLATRMAYFLWNDGPDDILREAAEEGALDTVEGLRAQVTRMMDDARFSDILYRFHNAALGGLSAFTSDNIDLRPSVIEERRRFVQHIADQNGGWRELLTDNTTFVNASLASLYGLTGGYSEEEFTRVQLDADQRRGALTQVGFLSGVQTTPVHRGLWVSRMIACNSIGRPMNVSPPGPPAPGQSRREVYENITEQPGSVCAACHTTVINPFGFPFESYDELGRYRTEYGDNFFNAPVDPSVEGALMNGKAWSFNNALELIDTIAQLPSAHRCYGKHWTEFALNRPATSGDTGLIENIGKLSFGGGSISDIVQYIVRSPSFRQHLRPEGND